MTNENESPTRVEKFQKKCDDAALKLSDRLELLNHPMEEKLLSTFALAVFGSIRDDISDDASGAQAFALTVMPLLEHAGTDELLQVTGILHLALNTVRNQPILIDEREVAKSIFLDVYRVPVKFVRCWQEAGYLPRKSEEKATAVTNLLGDQCLEVVSASEGSVQSSIVQQVEWFLFLRRATFIYDKITGDQSFGKWASGTALDILSPKSKRGCLAVLLVVIARGNCKTLRSLVIGKAVAS